jgi:hypothetical protein
VPRSGGTSSRYAIDSPPPLSCLKRVLMMQRLQAGAHDGVTMSNTWALERHYNWTGLLVEPNSHFHALAANRPGSRAVRACLGPRDGEAVQFVENDDSRLEGSDGLFAGILGAGGEGER